MARNPTRISLSPISLELSSFHAMEGIVPGGSVTRSDPKSFIFLPHMLSCVPGLFLKYYIIRYVSKMSMSRFVFGS